MNPQTLRSPRPTPATSDDWRIGLPKGRMQDQVQRLLKEAGIEVSLPQRGYRARLSLPGCEAKLLKPQNVVEMLQNGSRDVGFAGADWVEELGGGLVEVLDTELDPVRVVLAAPPDLLTDGQLPSGPLRIATEYKNLTRQFIERRGIEATCLRSYGATEVFPPEDADAIVDNTASGATLRANNLVIVEQLMQSSTRLFANPRALDDVNKRRAIDDLALVLRAVIEARRRVMLELNVPADKLETVVAMLPCMRTPTVAPLHGDLGFAVRAAVPRRELASLIPRLQQTGGTDLVVTAPSQIVP